MFRTACLGLLLLAGCHGFFGGRTTDEDEDLNNFAEARQRAATYYDGADYERAASQYKRALEYRPGHVPTRLGYAFSLMFTKQPKRLARALEEFEDLGPLDDNRQEVKRIYGLAVTHRTLAARYQAQSIYHDRRGLVDWRDRDSANARDHANQAIGFFERILSLDTALAVKQKIAPQRVSASLTPDAHAGMAHCEILLADKEHPEHLVRAVEHIGSFATTAGRARKFWEKRRERTLVTDPLHEGDSGRSGTIAMGGEERARYEKRILSTISQEVAMRRALVEVYIQMGRYPDAIDECDTIQNLDPSVDRIYWLRGQAYANLDPPDYRAALKDLKEYRSRQDLGRLTEDLIRINRWITIYKRKIDGGTNG